MKARYRIFVNKFKAIKTPIQGSYFEKDPRTIASEVRLSPLCVKQSSLFLYLTLQGTTISGNEFP